MRSHKMSGSVDVELWRAGGERGALSWPTIRPTTAN